MEEKSFYRVLASLKQERSQETTQTRVFRKLNKLDGVIWSFITVFKEITS